MTFCSKCLLPQSATDQKARNLIKAEYLKNDIPWYVGYSGGKDSSCLLTILFNALLEIKNPVKLVNVIYCDTGVEIPTISAYVKETIGALTSESESLGLPLKFIIARPKLDDRYFVKVIGRGYPPPTNIFRWCTDRLRINPVKSIIDSNQNAVVLLGIRSGESLERDRKIQKHKTKERYFLNQGDSTRTRIFSPILDYSVKDVWASLKFNCMPRSIKHDTIGQLYKDAGAECPVYKETKGTPCGKGRFGCWTCTVVRQDKSVKSMIESGYEDLEPLFEFRNWIAIFRDDTDFRCKIRRNGQIGLGPITLEGRKMVLEKLFEAERKSGLTLIENEELTRIKELWHVDETNLNYLEH